MDISVIIPCRNCESFLGVAIASLLRQTLQPKEIIVVDDGSTDRSAAIARSFGPPVSVLRGVGAGASRARLIGLSSASGDALMFFDADDFVTPDTLEALADVLADHKDAVAICPWMRAEQHADGAWLPSPPSCARRGPRQDDLSAWLSGWYHPPCAVLWSRPAYERSGGWDPNLERNQDGDLMMRGLVGGNRLVLSRGGTAFYRRRPEGSVSLSTAVPTYDAIRSQLAVIDGIAVMLKSDGRLANYAKPLRIAYRNIGDRCPEAFDDLSQCAQDRAVALPKFKSRCSVDAGLLHHLGRTISRAPSSVTTSLPPRNDPNVPAVSVIVPTYNRALATLRAVNSVLYQDYVDFELLVVDDCSTDDTVDTLTRLTDPRIRVIRLPVNSGVAAARNRGLTLARGKYLAFLDSDDEWLPGKLAKQVALLDGTDDRTGLVYTGVEQTSLEGKTVVLPDASGMIFDMMLQRNRLHGGGSSVVFRRSVFDLVGGFDETLPAIEDYDMWLRICRFFEVRFIEETLVRYHDDYRESEDGVRRSRDRARNHRARQILFDRYACDLQRAGLQTDFLLDTARKAATERGTRPTAFRTLLSALRRNPADPRLYVWLPLVLLSNDTRNRILTTLRKALPVERAPTEPFSKHQIKPDR